MTAFDPRTATQAEFEAEARRLHGLRVARIKAMTDEEKEACNRFMMPGLLERYRRLEINQLVPVSTVDTNIAECVRHHRNDVWQSSPEYAAAFDHARTLPDRSAARAHMEAAKTAFLERVSGGGAEESAPAPAIVPEAAKAEAEACVDGLARTRSKRKCRAILGGLLERLGLGSGGSD